MLCVRVTRVARYELRVKEENAIYALELELFSAMWLKLTLYVV